MGRKPESDDADLAEILWVEIGYNFEFWLSKQNSEHSRHTRLKLSREFDIVARESAKTDAEGQRLAQIDWLVRRVLTPGRPDSIFPAEHAQRIRVRLLSKVREARRRGGPNSKTVRLSADVARDLAQLAKAWGYDARADVVDVLTRNALETLLADPRG